MSATIEKNGVVNNEVTTNAITSAILKAQQTELHKDVTLTESCIANAMQCQNLSRLRTLYLMLKNDKETFKIKERLALRRMVRENIFVLAKDENKDEYTKEIQTKKATEKQNLSSGFNKMLDFERRSLGACLNVINGALMMAKESPDKVYDFKETKTRKDVVTGTEYEVTTEFNVKFDSVKFDVVNFARKNRDFYNEFLNLIQVAELGNLTEKKVNKFINDNIEALQNIKAERKAKIEAERKAK